MSTITLSAPIPSPFELVGQINGKIFVLWSSYRDAERVNKMITDEMVHMPTGYILEQKCMGGVQWYFGRQTDMFMASTYQPMFECEMSQGNHYDIYIPSLCVSDDSTGIVFKINHQVKTMRHAYTVLRGMNTQLDVPYHYFCDKPVATR